MYYPVSIDLIQKKVAKKRFRYDNKHDETLNIRELTNEFGETIMRVDGEIPIDLPVEVGQRFLFISYDQTRWSHGIHKYPAKFFPELPRWLIKKYSKEGDTILDPFMGSATTNIECLLNNRNSVGVDVDPFAKLLAKVKTTPLNQEELATNNQTILDKIIQYSPDLITDDDLPNFPYRDNWFRKDILKEVTYIKNIIGNLDISQELLDFYRICLSSIIRNVSNADDNCTRTVVRKSLNKKIENTIALTKFTENLLVFSNKILDFSNNLTKNTFEIAFDSVATDIRYEEETFDLAVTSPPYCNAVDYPRTHQLELYLLELSKGSLAELKKKHVGTENVSSIDYKDLHLIQEDLADRIITEIYALDKRRAYICYKYLADMKANMQEVYRTLKVGGRYVIVVGNNTIRGKNFESWRYLMNIAEQIGFKIENYFGSEIIKHFIKVPREQRINTDWIIVLQK